MATIQVNKLRIAGVLGSFAVLLGALAYAMSRPRIIEFSLPNGDPYTYGIMRPSARILPAEDWTDTVPQVERAFCITKYDATVQVSEATDNTRVRYIQVTEVERAKVSDALPWRIADIACSNDSVPVIHTHLPISCKDVHDSKNCSFGGILAFFCQPSRTDYQSLIETKALFGVIQCGRDQFVFYYP